MCQVSELSTKRLIIRRNIVEILESRTVGEVFIQDGPCFLSASELAQCRECARTPVKEREEILRYKEEDTKALEREFNGKINKEDFCYYITAIQEKEFFVDQKQLKEYFPIDVVTKGLMDIYQRLLGLTFSKVEGVPVWHPDVELYKVEDTASKETIGYFFLDLFPREGKY